MSVSKITSLSISSISKIYGIELSKLSSIYGQTIAPTWLTGWSYRKSITLSRASGAVTNYQMKLLVGESSGATGEDVDCGGKCLSNFNDIRFTTSDKTTLLDYWIESVSGTTPNQLATVWVEFDSIGTSDTTFYMYYGNSSASAYSNGNNTFIFFDHFDGDLSKWSGNGISKASVSSSIMTMVSNGAYGIYPTNAFSGDFAIRTKANLQDSNYAQLLLTQTNFVTNWVGIYHDGVTKHSTSKAGAETVWSTTDAGFGSYHIYDICRYISGTDTVRTFTDGVQNGTGSTTNVPTIDLYACIIPWGNVTIKSDWLLARQYVESEPAWGTWGAEENKWLDGWLYRKPITLSRASGAVTDYQMKVLVSKSASATGEDVDCNGNCLDNFDDLRFTTDNGVTLLDYWIESISSDVATIWVEFDSIGTGDTTFYMYYGNSSASAYSNGVNTFPFFDHFEGTSLDTNKWNLTGSVTTSSSEVTLDGSDQIYGKTSFGLGYTLRTKVKANEQDSIFAEWWIDINNRCSMENSDAVYPDDFDRIQYSHVKSGSIGASTYLDNAEDFRNTYAIYEVFRNSSSSLIRTKYGSSNTYSNEYTNSTYIITSDAYPSLRVWNSSQESTLIGDWILIRKQIATEPAWGSWGTEENK